MTSTPTIACLLAAVTAAAVPLPALADDAETIVVTGQGLDVRAADRTADVVTINRARIAESASARLEAILGDVAGLQQFRRSDSRSANPTSQGLSLRGIGGNASSRALLVLDGVPQADPFGGWVAFPAYATDRIGQIRVTRGGGSGYFGAGALAGTVEIDSRTPGADDPLRATLAYGSRDSLDANASAALVRDRGFATLSAAYARGDGFTPIVGDDRGPIDRPAGYEQASGALRAVLGVADATELQAGLSAFTDSRERGTPFTANRSEGADASVRLVGRGAWGYSVLAYLQTRGFASQFASINVARTTATATLDQVNTPATGLGGRIEIVPPVGEGIDLRLGADVRALSGRTQELFTFVGGAPTRRRVAGGETRTTGLFVDGSVEAGGLTVALGGRLDWWRIDNGSLREITIATGMPVTTADYADRQGAEATGRAGLAWSPSDALTLRVSGYRGWRLPTLNELYRPFRVGVDATAANAALAPERLTGVGGGVMLAPLDGVTLSATLFWNRLENAISNVTVGRGPGSFPGVGFVAAGGAYRIRQNLDAIRSTGFELEADYQGGPFVAQGSWSHASPRVEASGAAAALDHLRPAQTPRDLVSATVGWRRDGAAISATLRHTARQFEDDQNSRSLAPATTLDGYLSLPVIGEIAVVLRGENILDERVEAGISGAGLVERATPRTIWVGLRLGS